jgi:hypothetical protein
MNHKRSRQLGGRRRGITSPCCRCSDAGDHVVSSFLNFSILVSHCHATGNIANEKGVNGPNGPLRGFLEQSLGGGGDGDNYDPRKCSRMVNDHCADEDGGAWRYRDGEGRCTYVENGPDSNIAPKDWTATNKVADVFPDIRSVVDFGGRPGTYLTGLLNMGLPTLITMEPPPLGDNLFVI